jgi:hypothetical protein
VFFHVDRSVVDSRKHPAISELNIIEQLCTILFIGMFGAEWGRTEAKGSSMMLTEGWRGRDSQFDAAGCRPPFSPRRQREF